jgi:hypothetical protein
MKRLVLITLLLASPAWAQMERWRWPQCNGAALRGPVIACDSKFELDALSGFLLSEAARDLADMPKLGIATKDNAIYDLESGQLYGCHFIGTHNDVAIDVIVLRHNKEGSDVFQIELNGKAFDSKDSLIPLPSNLHKGDRYWINHWIRIHSTEACGH